MSVSANAAKFPVPCANSACGRELCGPVKHCPFCGHAVRQAVPVATPAASPAAPIEVKAPEPLHFDLGAVKPAAPAAPAPAPSAAPPKAAAAAPSPAPGAPNNPGGLLKKLALSFAALVIIAGVTSYFLSGSKHNQQQLEQALLAGQQCLRAGDFNCAQDNAERVLQKDRNDPAAQSLLQRAKDGLERNRKSEESAQLAAEKARADKAKADQLASEQAEKDRRDKAERDRLAEEQAQRIAKEASVVQSPPPAVPKSKPTTSSGGATPTMLGNTLNEARRALDRKDYQSAITVAGLVLNMDPGNRQAQNIINQARQQQAQALNRTTIE